MKGLGPFTLVVMREIQSHRPDVDQDIITSKLSSKATKATTCRRLSFLRNRALIEPGRVFIGAGVRVKLSQSGQLALSEATSKHKPKTHKLKPENLPPKSP